MASIYDIKPLFQRTLRPIMHALRKARVTPNVLTIGAFLGSAIVGGLMIGWGHRSLLLILPGWLFIRMALNALDGMMARRYELQTDLGAILNELGDVLSDLVLYIPLLSLSNGAFWSILVFGIGSVINEFCGLLPETLGGSRHYEGPMGKSDRAALIGALTAGTYVYPMLADYWSYVLWIGSLLMILSCYKRLSNGLAEIQSGRDIPS